MSLKSLSLRCLNRSMITHGYGEWVEKVSITESNPNPSMATLQKGLEFSVERDCHILALAPTETRTSHSIGPSRLGVSA
jgi:hypothetical protein